MEKKSGRTLLTDESNEIDRADIPQFDFQLESFHTILGNFVVSIHVLLDTETRTFQLNLASDIDQAVDHNAHIGTQG